MNETINEYTDLIYGYVEDTLDRHGKMFFRKDLEQYLRDVWDASRKQALTDAANVKPNRVQEDKKPATSDLDAGYNMGYIDALDDMWNALEALV